MDKKCVGIIGGMGPLACVDMFDKMVRLTKASRDSEHIHIIIDNNTTIPDRADAILHGGDDPMPKMIESAKRLEAAGAQLLLIACNTAHHYYDGVVSSVDTPVLHMPQEVAAQCRRLGYQKVGLLATDMILKTGVYHKALSRDGIEAILPSPAGQSGVMRLIYDGVKKGDFGLDITGFRAELDAMRKSGAQAFILGCTELPIAFRHYDIEYPYIDSTMVTARAAILAAGYELN